jgi:uncharacterized protein (DUF849 family)/N-acetylglutamate synthase-like GNAT family acetyltransferase
MNKTASHGALYGGAPPPGITAEPVIINCCLSGNVPTKATSPYLPVSVEEIVADALAVLESGASMLHIHARATDGSPAWQPEIYGRIFEGIRRHQPEAILVATTSGRQHASLEKRSAVLSLDGLAKPDMASLTLGSLNFPDQPSVNSPETIQALCQLMRERGITPELEVFDSGMLNYAFYLQRKGFLPQTCYVNLLLGSLGTGSGRVLDLASLVREIPGDWIWAGAGIGRYQLAMNSAALLMGGQVRVGLEDNPCYDYVECEAATNQGLVERIVRLARLLGRPIATCSETRQQLRLNDPGNWAATQVVIRKIRVDDLESALAILAKWNMAPIQASQAIPQPERDHLETENTFVAILRGRVVGVASWLQIDTARAETASLAVDREVIGCGIGYKLQEARLADMRSQGIRQVRTEADRPEVIRWYVAKFGYRITGTNPKKHAFGLAGRDHWTVLELELP